MMMNRRLVTASVAAILVVAALYAGLRPPAVLVEVAEVETTGFRITVEEEGITRVKDRYLVSAPVSGYIRRIESEVGDHLQQAQLLTELEPLRSNVLDARSRAEAEARVAAARSSLLSAEEQVAAVRADADYAAGEHRRKLKLSESKVISEEELSQARTLNERAKAMLRSANFAVDVARYELDAAGTLLKYSAAQESSDVLRERVAIRSPVSGSVLKIHRESEGVVKAGDPLLEVGDSRALEVAVDVLSFDAVRISPGTPVELSRWGGPALQGVVKLIEPVGFTEVSALGVDEQRVWVIIDISSPAPEWQSLGDGYRVEATFVLWEGNNVLQVPNSSLFRNSEGWALYSISDNRAVLRQVDIGRNNGLQVQILKGLEEGEQVIRHPDNNLKNGARVKIRN
jgi:HlyD family secretion protein